MSTASASTSSVASAVSYSTLTVSEARFTDADTTPDTLRVRVRSTAIAQFAQVIPWVDALGVSWNVGADGISVAMLMLTSFVITAGALALAAAVSAPAAAQQAGEQAAVKHGGGQCAISQAMLAAISDNKQRHMEETKSRIDSLIENALASTRSTKLAQTPIKLGKITPDG